jgi:ParB family chromosome partitioning protein
MATASPALDAQPFKPRFERIALGQLTPSPNNPRRFNAADPTLRELAESLRTLGQIEPIVVQEFPDEPDRFEILAGERRWRAAELAGLTEIEAKIIAPTEQQALEITVVENLQRQDLDPLSEARGVEILLSKGWDVATIASHLGKSPRWVHLRAGLTKLTASWTDAMAQDSSVCARFSAGHLELIARLTPEQQELALEKIDDLANQWDGTVVSREEFADNLAQKFIRDLSTARWDLHDGALTKAGACAACPKRSSCQQQIFGDLPTGKNKDHCLDAECWSKKEIAWLKRQESAAKEEHGTELIKIDPETHWTKGKALGLNDYQKAKEGDRGAKPALVTAGADKGEVVWVKPKANAAQKQESEEDRAKEREREKIERDREDFIGDAVHDALKKTKRPDDETLIRMAAVSMEQWDNNGARAFDPKTKTDTLRNELWEEICRRFDWSKCEAQLCKLANIDHAALVASAAAKFPDVSEGVVEAKSPVVKRVIVKKAKGGKIAKPKAKKGKA